MASYEEDDVLGTPNVQGVWEEGWAALAVEDVDYMEDAAEDSDESYVENEVQLMRDVTHTHPDYQCNL